MLIVSPVMSKASGSLAGLTASHNKGGMYFRQRSTPVNPATAFQQEVRNAVTLLTSAWSDDLVQGERDAWAVYAANQPLLNVFGESKLIPPLSHYVRSNVARLQAGLAREDAAPTIFVLPTFTDPTFAVIGTTGATTITFTNTDAWATEVGGFMAVYISRPQSVGINYFKGPFRFLGSVNGAVVPPTSPAVFTSPFLGTAGNKYFFRVVVGRADGRMSAERFYFDIAA